MQSIESNSGQFYCFSVFDRRRSGGVASLPPQSSMDTTETVSSHSSPDSSSPEYSENIRPDDHTVTSQQSPYSAASQGGQQANQGVCMAMFIDCDQ